MLVRTDARHLIRRLVASVSLALAGGSAHSANAQPSGQDTITRAPSVMLLRQVAEAVDGTRTGGLVWVVVRDAAPQQVIDVVTSESAARALLQRDPRAYSILGPFRAPAMDDGFIDGCFHLRGSEMVGYCPMPLRWGQIDSVSLRVRLRDGSVRITPIPVDADAVFLRWSGIDKFVVPYYVRVLGADSAAAMRRALATPPRPGPAPDRPPR